MPSFAEVIRESWFPYPKQCNGYGCWRASWSRAWGVIGTNVIIDAKARALAVEKGRAN